MAEKYRNRYQGGGWDGSVYDTNREMARFATRHPLAAWVTWHSQGAFLAAKDALGVALVRAMDGVIEGKRIAQNLLQRRK